MLSNYLETWLTLEPDEWPNAVLERLRKFVDSVDPGLLMEGYLRRCIQSRGWAYDQRWRNGSYFATICLIETIINKAGADHLTVLLNAYLSTLASLRYVAVGPWQHFKGDEFQVIGIGKHDASGVENYPGVQNNIYTLEETKGKPVSVYLNYRPGGERFVYRADQNYGERVFYVGDHGRWARKVDDFLALVGPEHPEQQGKLRFKRIG